MSSISNYASGYSSTGGRRRAVIAPSLQPDHAAGFKPVAEQIMAGIHSDLVELQARQGWVQIEHEQGLAGVQLLARGEAEIVAGLEFTVLVLDADNTFEANVSG